MNQLALVTDTAPENAVSALRPFALQLADIKKQNAKFVFDYTDPAQNKAARSHIDKLRATKAAIEKEGKKAREGYLAAQRAVIAEEKLLVAEVVEMIEVHAVPLKEYEAQEQRRIDAIKARIDAMTVTAEWVIDRVSLELREREAALTAMNVDTDFDEFRSEAFAARMVGLEYLKGAIAIAEKREAEALELAKLREEAEARRLADEAAAAAKLAEEERQARERAEAEQLARETKAAEERKAAEIARIQREREEAAEAERKRAAEEAARREAEHAVALKKAEDDRIAAEQQAQRDRDAAAVAAQKALEDAERRQAEAIAAEQRRVAAEQAAKDAEEARKAADREHRGQVHSRIVADMARSSGITPEQAKAVVIAICGDQIPDLKIVY